MSKLDELIKELCPAGVEYYKIADIFNTRNGYTPSKNNPEYWANGTVPWFRMEDIRENGQILSDSIQHVNSKAVKGKLFPADSIIVATSATIGQHALIKIPSLANQRFTYLMLKADWIEKFDIKFIFYYCYKLDDFCLGHLNQGNFASVDMKQFAEFRFPVPPLEVQREIVRVLDNFTFLSAELSAELSARRKQYEYYRGELLNFHKEIPWRKLGETCDMKAGKAIPSEMISDYETDETPIKCYGGNGLRGYVKDANQHGDYPLIGRQGALCGNVNYATGDFYATEHAVVVKSMGEYTHRFLYHMLKHMNLNQYKSAGAQPGLAVKNLQEISAPVPSIETQNRIVEVLDNFETICSDLSIGLPAEIEARQKQYEYYRDLLLTFAESGNSILTDRQTDRQTDRMK